MHITTSRGELDLSEDFTIQIDEKSPITNDRGSQSVPVTVPCTAVNARVTGFAHRMDQGTKVMDGDTSCNIQDGTYVRRGTINIVSAGKREGITLNIGFDNSEAYSRWKATKMNQLECPQRPFGTISDLCQLLDDVFRQQSDDDFAVFPLMVDNPEVNGTRYPVILNGMANDGHLKFGARQEYAVINGDVVQTYVPEGYGVTPFLYVWRALEIIFSSFGYELAENPFKDDKELASIVVLNNVADAVCNTSHTLFYSDMMPSCTVEEFLQSVYARFGAVYGIDTDTRKARIRLMRDIVKAPAAKDYTACLADWPLVNYTVPKQLRLSAKTSFEGAATEVDRFEDFTKDGAVTPFYFEYGGAFHRYLSVKKWLGQWFRWDGEHYLQVSSSFFVWDKKTAGLEYEDVASQDECVPMCEASGAGTMGGYMAGAVHKYTEVRLDDGDAVSEDKEDTPLSFLIALRPDNIQCTYGSSFPYLPGGQHYEIDGTPYSFQLTWQFENGLFQQFWRDYDAILRHAFNEVEVKCSLQMAELRSVDFLAPVMMYGQLLLIDALSYSMPLKKYTEAAMVLKTLRLVGPYDLDREQFLIPIHSVTETLIWVIDSKQWINDDQFYESYARQCDPHYQDPEWEEWYVPTLNENTYEPVGLTPEQDMLTFDAPTAFPQYLRKSYRANWYFRCAGYYDRSAIHPGEDRVYVSFQNGTEIDYDTNFRSRPLNS